MNGWVILALLAALLGAGLWVVIRPARMVSELIAAAVLVALAGYAWQGSPMLAGKPTGPRDNRPAPANLFGDERGKWLEQVGVDAQALDAADGLIRSGDPAYAIGILRAALEHRPKSATLWIGLGNAISLYADGLVTPPARYAFQHASQLAPQSPAPAYFLGLSLAQSGDLDGAEQSWRGLLAKAPADAAWRSDVEQKLAAIDRARSLR
ncbi:cytochrome C biogenesis protein [Sphingomonas sp. AP4-R1]|uniref:tetratricopeptide repeat protein n=1 Tax=Sphingomonas sp. AP4-R1 TaxID=2735134 RepID=UPI001493DCA8|nr:cytochrome C biogenesis protein [Sphingomonas sp. AP4-R1]QJU59004.1 cytochrome C biogenesis protein [Sphingomonas sp. AP4-R1]